MRLQRFVSFLIASFLTLAGVGFAQRALSEDVASRRMELMQEKQLAMQELQLALMQAQNLQQEDMNAQLQQAQLAKNQKGFHSFGDNLSILQQGQELIVTRQRIAQELSENKKRELELTRQIRDIDSQLRAFK